MQTMNKTTAGLASAAVLAAALLLAGCDALPGGYVPIKEITTAGAKFESREVKVKGTVVDVMRVPVLDYRVFMLKDDTGEIPVVTKGSLPAVNDRVALRGLVLNTAVIADYNLGLRIEELKRLQ